MTEKSLRRRFTFVEHRRLLEDWREIRHDTPITNLIHKAKNEEERWIEEATSEIGEWRSDVRSVYLRWAITINAMCIAEDHYKKLPEDRALQTKTLRMISGEARQVAMTTWSGREASEIYAEATSLVAGYGIADLYGCLEEIIFDFYEIYLKHHPSSLMRGDEFRELRRLYRDRDRDQAAQEAWSSAWQQRYALWRRNKGYDGLGRTFKSIFDMAGLKRPSLYNNTDVELWSEIIDGIGELRHLITHGADRVSGKLGEFSRKSHAMTFDFIESDQLTVSLHHLQSVECFSDQLLTAINLSLIELANGPVKLLRPDP